MKGVRAPRYIFLYKETEYVYTLVQTPGQEKEPEMSGAIYFDIPGQRYKRIQARPQGAVVREQATRISSSK